MLVHNNCMVRSDSLWVFSRTRMASKLANLMACHNKYLMVSNLVLLTVFLYTGNSPLYRFRNTSSNTRILLHKLALPEDVLGMSRTLLLYHHRTRDTWLT